MGQYSFYSKKILSQIKKVVSFHKCIFVFCGNTLTSDECLLDFVQEASNIEKYFVESLLRFSEVPDFVIISSLAPASIGLNL